MKRELRISQFKDYVAVDYLDDTGLIKTTPFYIRPGESKRILYKDAEENKWMGTTVKLSADFENLSLIDTDGFSWESSIDELLDSSIIRFI